MPFLIYASTTGDRQASSNSKSRDASSRFTLETKTHGFHLQLLRENAVKLPLIPKLIGQPHIHVLCQMPQAQDLNAFRAEDSLKS